MATESKRLVILALVANGVIAVTKFIAAGISGSAAMLSEAIHSVADSGNQLFLLRGHAASRYTASVQHPYGRGKEIYFWGFVVAILIFAVGAGLSIVIPLVFSAAGNVPGISSGRGIAGVATIGYAGSSQIYNGVGFFNQMPPSLCGFTIPTGEVDLCR